MSTDNLCRNGLSESTVGPKLHLAGVAPNSNRRVKGTDIHEFIDRMMRANISQSDSGLPAGRIWAYYLSLLSVVAGVLDGAAFGQARAPSVSNRCDTPVTVQSHPGPEKVRTVSDSWLRRLPGRYRIDGEIMEVNGWDSLATRKATGSADCALIGSGPGVNCMISIKWARISVGAGFGLSEHLTMRPAVLLFGFDPNSG